MQRDRKILILCGFREGFIEEVAFDINLEGSVGILLSGGE